MRQMVDIIYSMNFIFRGKLLDYLISIMPGEKKLSFELRTSNKTEKKESLNCGLLANFCKD